MRTARAPAPPLVGLALLGLLLAGCADGEPAGAGQATPTGHDQDAKLGSVRGLVIDEEALPVEGARVAIQAEGGSFDRQAATDKTGTFEIAQVPPGAYRFFAERLGFESVGHLIHVNPGEVTTVDVTLVLIEVIEVYQTTEILVGFIGCSITVIYPAGDPGYTAWQCGDVAGNEGWYPNHDPYLNWTIPEDVVTHLLELTWEPTTASADQLRWQIADSLDCYLNFCFVGSDYQTQAGPGPLVYRLEDGDGLPDELPSSFMSRVSSGPATTTSPVRVVLDQPFEQYTTSWFGAAAPEGWTALPAD